MVSWFELLAVKLRGVTLLFTVALYLLSYEEVCDDLPITRHKGVSRIFIMGFPLVRNYRNIFGISSDQLLTI